MSEIDRNAEAAFRRARVDKLKKIIVTGICVLVIFPNICSIFLIVRLIVLDRKLDSVYEELEQFEKQLVGMEEQKSTVTFYSQAKSPRQEPEKKDVVSEAVEAQTQTETESVWNPEENESTAAVEPQEENAGEDVTEHKHLVYLTFDDGPSIYTDEILDILADYDVKATFFVVGKTTEEDQERIKRIVAEGHTLGMHSYSHRYSEIYHSVENFQTDFYKIQNYLLDVTGVKSVFYRFPGGSSNSVSNVDVHELAAFLDQEGVTYFDWNISSGDADNIALTVEDLVTNSTRNIEKYHTCVVLMHDSASKHSTVEALPQIIENILAMDDAVILPITEETEPVQHNIK